MYLVYKLNKQGDNIQPWYAGEPAKGLRPPGNLTLKYSVYREMVI